MSDEFSYLGGVTRTSGSTSSSAPYKVMGGIGFLVGNSEGAVARSLLSAGPIQIIDGDGIVSHPVITARPGIVTLAEKTIDAAVATTQLIEFAAEVEHCEITTISLRFLSKTPDSTYRAGLYAAPPISGIPQPGAEILPIGSVFSTWAGGNATVRLSVASAIRRPVALYWVTEIANVTPMTFEVSVWGMPKWQKTWS